MSDVCKGLDSSFVSLLNAEYQRGGWWKAIASDPELFIAVRDGYLNVYFRGASLLKLRQRRGRLVGQTHYKYLLQPDSLTTYVEIIDGVVRHSRTAPSDYFLADLSDLGALKRAAVPFTGIEKAGVHQIILSNPNVIDVEIAFRQESPDEEDSGSTTRIDFAALRDTSKGVRLSFFEAKQFSNPALRAAGSARPPVIGQMEGYGDLLRAHQSDLHTSFRAVCGNLASLFGVRDRYSTILDILHRVHAGETLLEIDGYCSLVVFGYDSDQSSGTAWAPHRRKLEDALKKGLLLKGTPKDFKRGISSPSR